MKIILGKTEVEDAIECYLSRQGLSTEQYYLDIKIIVSRSSEDTKIEVDMTHVDTKSTDKEEPEVANPFSESNEVSGE